VSTPEELMPQLAQLMTSGKIALVFGPEPSGLSNEEIAECHHLVSIPADENYPALNLAQAVAVCLYALRVAWLSQEAGPGEVEELATFDELERMFTVLQKGLSDVGYLRGDRGPVLWHAVRHLLTRARPSPMEVGLLFGLGRQLEWYTSQHSKEKGEQDPRPQRGNAEE
jgi:TrmH family RNA methyltransferase